MPVAGSRKNSQSACHPERSRRTYIHCFTGFSRLAAAGALSFFINVGCFIGIQACFAGWLGPKKTKTQGLELLSDKFVKALLPAALCPMKNRAACAAFVEPSKKV